MSIEFYLYVSLLACCILLGLLRYRRLSAPFRMLLALLALTLASEVAGRWMAYAYRNSSPVYHFYVLISFWLYSYIFQSFYKKNKMRFTVLFLTIPFTVFSIVNSLAFEKLQQFPSHSILVSSVLLVIYALMLFRQLLLLKPGINVLDKSYFWFATGVLFFFSVQIFDWGMFSYLLKKGKDVMALVYFGVAASIIFYIILGACLYLDSLQAGDRTNAKN